MNTVRIPVAATFAACVVTAVLWGASLVREPFPHALHEGLFPDCAGCHAGIASGDAATFYPDASACATCHDGSTVHRVDFSPPPAPRASNLDFTHADHLSRAADTAGSDPRKVCTTCHQAPGATGLMDVGPPRPEACLTCHAHEAPSHLAPERPCLECHVTVAEATRLSAAAVADFPRPAWHDDPTFPSAHGPDPRRAATTCAVCHARESCTRCHANADKIPSILALAPDERVAVSAATRAPAYPRPESHQATTWRWGHGSVARAGADSCANCHTRANCTLCHRADLEPLAALPVLEPGDPRGVRMAEAPEVHPAGFQKRHGTDAADGGATCAACHAQDFCTTCHAGASTPRFHEPDFIERHGPDVYGSDVECVSCHNPEVFCRACHDQAGLGSRGRLDVAFHTANPFWLVGHGQAARQGLQGCVTCHSESDCVQCHAAVGGWGINPHGPDFDPSRPGDAGRFGCLPCHRGRVPGGGS